MFVGLVEGWQLEGIVETPPVRRFVGALDSIALILNVLVFIYTVFTNFNNYFVNFNSSYNSARGIKTRIG